MYTPEQNWTVYLHTNYIIYIYESFYKGCWIKLSENYLISNHFMFCDYSLEKPFAASGPQFENLRFRERLEIAIFNLMFTKKKFCSKGSHSGCNRGRCEWFSSTEEGWYWCCYGHCWLRCVQTGCWHDPPGWQLCLNCHRRRGRYRRPFFHILSMLWAPLLASSLHSRPSDLWQLEEVHCLHPDQ